MKSSLTQHGIALITALLVVALATLAAVAMTARQQLDIRRTANIINGEQAYIYALGGESWSKRILLRDGKNSTIDNLNEIWATHLPPLPIPGGTIQAQIEDLQSRFNLNNLILMPEEEQVDTKNIFKRLLQILELPPTLVRVIIDWIDTDINAQLPDGAEDNTYLTKTFAYRTSNTLLSSPTEVRLLAGFDKDSYQKLLPYISTLPTPTLINVNTAPVPVLMALVEGLSEMDASALIVDREKKPFGTVNDFLAHNALAGLTVNANHISVSSDYFLLTAQVQIDKGQTQLNSILHRLSNQVKIIMRSQGNF